MKNNLIPIYTKHIFKTVGYSKTAMFAWRSILRPKTINRWLQYSHNKHNALAPWNFINKPLRTYVARHIPMPQRVDLIISHYKILQENFPKNCLEQLQKEQAVKFACLTAKSGHEYNMVFLQNLRFRREGELSIALQDSADSATLAIITFVLGENSNGSKFAIIGGLQGPSVENGKERVVKATRDLHGLRPKNAVLNGPLCFGASAKFGRNRGGFNGKPPRESNEREKAEKLFCRL